jgi:choline dehydrogenase
MTEHFDLIVVGAGSAGCVVAARASEDPSLRVLLIEDGPDPRPIPDIVSNPKRQPELVLESPFVRMYEVHRPIDGSTFPLLSGRLVGGGSSVNNMSVIRPMRIDCEAWSRFGGPAWSYEALLPLMRGIEEDPDFGGSELHGDSGPLHLDRAFRLDSESPPADPRLAALVEASAAMGLPICDDLNVPEPLGVCASPYNIKDGRRQSTAVAFLEPARARPNLTLRADTLATRLVLDGSRVTGVEVRGPNGPDVVEADRVVVSSGVFHSPQLLMQSGIGRPDVIEGAGLTVVHPLAGVGENYQDHTVVYLTFKGSEGTREDDVVPKVRLIARSVPSLDHPDLHVFMRPAIRMPGLAPMYPWSVHLLENRARGRVTLATASPDDLPLVEPALLEHPDDIAAMTNAMRFVRDLVAQPALQAFYGDLLQPAPSDDWTDYARRTFTAYYHGVGTCRMGPADDPASVVDERLRVHGLDNLWVADASVVPVLPHANTNVSAILMGEIAAQSLRA